MMNPNINSVKVYKKVKVSHSLASVRAVGVRGSLYLGTVHESWSPSFALRCLIVPLLETVTHLLLG